MSGGNLPCPSHVPHPCFAKSRSVCNTPPLEMYNLEAACVCVFCVLVIHYEGAGGKRLRKAAQSSRLESPLPACVSHQLLTSRADSPLWWVWFSGEKASARRQRFVFGAATKRARLPRRAPPQAWAGQLQRRLQPCLHPECALRAGVPSRRAPLPKCPQLPPTARNSAPPAAPQSGLGVQRLAQASVPPPGVAETAMAITRINSVCLSGREPRLLQ